MDSAYREFDHKDLLKLPTRRMQAAWELAPVLIECLPKEFVEQSPDHSVIDALVYEVLRLYVMAQADFKIDEWAFISDPTELVRKLTQEFKIDSSDNGQVIPKDIRAAFSGKNFCT